MLHFRDLLGVLGSGAIAASMVFIAGQCTFGYMLGGSQVEIKGVVGLGTAARNIGAALVPASQSFSDPKIIMLVACTIVILIVLFPAAAWLRRKRLPVEANR